MTTSSPVAVPSPVEPRRPAGAGAFVVVVGPDGVGKSTVARAVLAGYPGERGYFHFAPPVLGSLAAAPPDGAAPPPKARGRGSRLLGLLRLARSFARFWAGYLVTVRPAVRRGALVVGDRWAYGYLVQPEALRFYGPRRVARAVLRLFPRPDLVVNLEAPVATIRARKQELSAAEIERELHAWRAVPAPRVRTLDASGPPDVIAAAILDELG